MKVIDYKVVRCIGVPAAIADGWQPWGSAYYAPTGNGQQPMVKYEKAPSISTPDLTARHRKADDQHPLTSLPDDERPADSLPPGRITPRTRGGHDG